MFLKSLLNCRGQWVRSCAILYFDLLIAHSRIDSFFLGRSVPSINKHFEMMTGRNFAVFSTMYDTEILIHAM